MVQSMMQRWRREDLLEKGSLLLRTLAWFFSLVAVAVLASNRNGGWMNKLVGGSDSASVLDDAIVQARAVG
ncbi:CASP-like protein [Canna indica]|uniref:CASP-like protein n=1 Tax=Canna indica TaxID=4628 RepID=A0AAQ3KA66_9LILI|nr:CASP-like protein [Canna indica]